MNPDDNYNSHVFAQFLSFQVEEFPLCQELKFDFMRKILSQSNDLKKVDSNQIITISVPGLKKNTRSQWLSREARHLKPPLLFASRRFPANSFKIKKTLKFAEQ